MLIIACRNILSAFPRNCLNNTTLMYSHKLVFTVFGGTEFENGLEKSKLFQHDLSSSADNLQDIKRQNKGHHFRNIVF